MWERSALALIADPPLAGESTELAFGEALLPLFARHPGDEEEVEEDLDDDDIDDDDDDIDDIDDDDDLDDLDDDEDLDDEDLEIDEIDIDEEDDIDDDDDDLDDLDDDDELVLFDDRPEYLVPPVTCVGTDRDERGEAYLRWLDASGR